MKHATPTPRFATLTTGCWRTLYRIVSALLLPAALLHGFRKHGAAYTLGQWWRMKMGGAILPIGLYPETLWLHAVSLGEMRTATLMLNAWQHQHPERFVGVHLLLTTHTATGLQAAQTFAESCRSLAPTTTITCTMMPFDLPSAWARFFATYRPSALILMEGEWWPALSWQCTASALPWCVVNARLSPRSFRRRQRLAALGINALWADPPTILAQDAEQQSRWQALAPSSTVIVAGQLKYAVTVSEPQRALGQMLRQVLAPSVSSPIFMLASTREGEEAIGVAIWRQARAALIAQGIHLRLLIVPRHPERVESVNAWLLAQGFRVLRRSLINPNAAENPVPSDDLQTLWLGDTMGEMLAYYHAATVALMGGGLLPFGGQNPLEAFAVGVPVLMGPAAHTYNFASVREEALAVGALRCAASTENLIDSLTTELIDLLTHPTAQREMLSAQKRLMQKHQGAMQQTLAFLQNHFAPRPSPQ